MISEQTRTRIAKTRDSFPQRRSAILPALHAVQDELGHVSRESIDESASILDLNPSDVFQVASFYSLIHMEEGGKFLIEVCVNLPCALRGADQLAAMLYRTLELDPAHEEGTTEDKVFSFRPTIECLAACSTAPMLQVNQRYFENLTEAKVDEILAGLRSLGAKYPDGRVPGVAVGTVAHATERVQQ